jgi:hypothetical protein
MSDLAQLRVWNDLAIRNAAVVITLTLRKADAPAKFRIAATRVYGGGARDL